MNTTTIKQAIVALLLIAASVGIGIALRRAPHWTASKTPTVAPEPASTPESRDRARYSHANEIRIALATYESSMRSYPETLAALVPKFLAAEPLDPSTKSPYQYRKDTGGYVLSFTLEAGVFALSVGDHVMTSRGFDMLNPEPEKPLVEMPAAVTVIPPEEDISEPAPRLPENPLPPFESADEPTLAPVEDESQAPPITLDEPAAP
jgi:hypothetical protein